MTPDDLAHDHPADQTIPGHPQLRLRDGWVLRDVSEDVDTTETLATFVSLLESARHHGVEVVPFEVRQGAPTVIASRFVPGSKLVSALVDDPASVGPTVVELMRSMAATYGEVLRDRSALPGDFMLSQYWFGAVEGAPQPMVIDLDPYLEPVDEVTEDAASVVCRSVEELVSMLLPVRDLGLDVTDGVQALVRYLDAVEAWSSTLADFVNEWRVELSGGLSPRAVLLFALSRRDPLEVPSYVGPPQIARVELLYRDLEAAGVFARWFDYVDGDATPRTSVPPRVLDLLPDPTVTRAVDACLDRLGDRYLELWHHGGDYPLNVWTERLVVVDGRIALADANPMVGTVDPAGPASVRRFLAFTNEAMAIALVVAEVTGRQFVPPAGLLEVLHLAAQTDLGRPSVVAGRSVELADRGCRVPISAWFS